MTFKDERLANYDWLQKQYVEGHRTTADIGEELGCSSGLVSFALQQAGIKARSKGDRAFKVKDCRSCGLPFQPTGSNTKDCEACREKALEPKPPRGRQVDELGRLLCIDCQEWKHPDEFGDDQSRPGGKNYKCIPCHYSRNKSWRETNADKNRASVAKAQRKIRYTKIGFTEEGYQAFLAAQDGLCAICRGTHADGSRLRTDHDHEVGPVRGLLCYNCNLMLGHSKDDPATLRRAADYLEVSKLILSLVSSPGS